MHKEFNTEGNCIEAYHYMLPSRARLEEVYRLVGRGKYFTIHSSRQSGKTTFIRDLVRYLNSEGNYYAIYCSLEKLQNISDAQQGIKAIYNILKQSFKLERLFDCSEYLKDVEFDDYLNLLEYSIKSLCNSLDKPLVLMFDEADCLEYDVLIPFLRQLRSGYLSRDMHKFIHSVGLIGMRNLRDYKADIRPQHASSGTVSPFNIAAGSFTLENFTLEEVERLYFQHTEATGQKFTPEAVERAHYYSGGHPWLVNAIAHECVYRIHREENKEDITFENIEEAVQTLIIRRDTHFDSLLERLKEDRVRKVVEPMINGELDEYENWESDDFRFVMDLGIIKRNKGGLTPANPMYREIIIRTLSYTAQEKLPIKENPDWLSDDGIDMNLLLNYFQKFWRANSDIWVEKFDYKEAAPHLILQAFLQRVINGGGHILREYATGRGRMDLCVQYKGHNYPIELKLYRGENTIQEGIEQTAGYMDIFGEKEGWLIVFDRKSDKSWDDKIYWQTENCDGKTIHVIGA